MLLGEGIHFIVMGIKQAISVHAVQENPENIKKNKENHGKENNKKIAEDTDNGVQPQKILHVVFTGVRQMNHIPVDEVLIGNGHAEQQAVCVLIAGQKSIGKTAGEKVNLLNRKIFFIHNNSVNILERK